MELEQPSLFGPPQTPTGSSAKSRHRWLFGGAVIMSAVASSPTLLALFGQAHERSQARGANLNRGLGELVEIELAALLTEAAQSQIAREAIQALPRDVPGYGKVTDIRWDWLGGGRKPADFIVQVTAKQLTVSHPVNVKVESQVIPHRWQNAVAASTLCRVARGEPVMPGRRLDVDRNALEWMAGVTKIRGGVDYFLLIATTGDQGGIAQIAAQGLLSTVVEEKGTLQLAIRRHGHRPLDIQYLPSSLLLPADFDVNQAFARALLPRAVSGFTRAALNLAAAQDDGATTEQLAQVAIEALQPHARDPLPHPYRR